MHDGILLQITTPFTFPDGKPLTYYVQRHTGAFTTIDDDGLTMFALRTLGYALDDKRNWRGIEALVESHGFKLTDSGEIEATFPNMEMIQRSAAVLSLFAGIVAWEAEHSQQRDHDFSLTNEVERLLRAKDPSRRLDFDVTVRVGQGEVKFDFLWGDLYVDAIPPHAQAINARLRKAILAEKESGGDIGMLFVVDDRQDRAKADKEIGVLGQVARTISLSNFQEYYLPA